MTEEEWQDELRRRDEIIDSYEGLKLDSLFEDARLSAIKCVLDKSITGERRMFEKLKELMEQSPERSIVITETAFNQLHQIFAYKDERVAELERQLIVLKGVIDRHDLCRPCVVLPFTPYLVINWEENTQESLYLESKVKAALEAAGIEWRAER